MKERILVAGHGGQGVLLLGKILAHAGIRNNLEATYLPSYGIEVRGGTANCHVVLSTDSIASPVVERADTLLIMNEPSFIRFRGILEDGGILIANSTMINGLTQHCLAIPATRIASELGNVKAANMVMLGAYAASKDTIPVQLLEETLKEMTASHGELEEINLAAFREGIRLAGGKTA